MIVYATIKERIYNMIKQRILHQQYPPGEKLNIHALAQEFGVSNAPVREALNLLVNDRLVTHTPNQTPQVVAFTREDDAELQNIMSILLIGVFHNLMELEDLPGLLAGLEQVIGQQRAFLHAKDPYRFAGLSLDFDRAIIGSLGNKWLNSYFKTIEDVFLLFTIVRQKNDVDTMRMRIGEHQQILDSIRAGDFSAYQQIILTHYSVE